ncbi:MAG: RNA polymerase sigma factor region1.1 domain-containing protein, partial [Xanthobacteraceae bacterium]
MTSNTKMTPLKEETLEKEGSEIRLDRPLLDLSDAAIKKLIWGAKKRGYVTHVQINELLSSEEVKSEQIEDILAKLSEMGVNVVETEEAEPQDEGAGEEPEVEAESERGELVEVRRPTAPAKASTEELTGRADDPVRMYFGEMVSLELLSREGEIAVAKRIEAGREAMIAGLCESPLTFQAIVIWRDELNDGKVLLRDIIDLDAQSLTTTQVSPDGQMIVPGQLPNAAPVIAIPFQQADKRTDSDEVATERAIGDSDLDDGDNDEDDYFSVAAIEAELKPKVIETFDTIAGTYKRLRRLQDQDIQFQLRRLSLSP